jgi:ClpP class serine protease
MNDQPDNRPFRALDLVMGTPWLITEDGLNQILAIAGRANEAPEAVAARLGRPLQNTRTVTERDGTAIIPVVGPIFRHANLFTEISGATSVEVLATDIQAAIDNPAIARLVLDLDSPGGQATGIAELAALIHASPKPVIAYVDGMAASAAYWIAAAADSIILSSTALVGSIGVVASYRPEKDGPIKIISSQSPLKQATPDTETGRAEAQRVVDQLGDVFIADVATYRGTDPETVTRDFGQGGILVGALAVAAGMADAVGTLESIIAGSPGATQRTYSMANPATAQAPEITREHLAANHPDLLTSITEDAKTAGIAEERARVTDILEASADHTHAMACAAIASGIAADQAAAMLAVAPLPAVLETIHDDQVRAMYRADFLAEGEHQAPSADSVTGDAHADSGSDPDAAARHAWDTNASLRAEFAGSFDRYQAFQKASASGRVRVLRAERAATHACVLARRPARLDTKGAP